MATRLSTRSSKKKIKTKSCFPLVAGLRYFILTTQDHCKRGPAQKRSW